MGSVPVALVGFFYAFIYLSWTAVPMFNLVLRLDRFGRYVLSADERRATNGFGVCFLFALAGLGAWALGYEIGLLTAIVGAGLSICVSVVFARQGRTRLGFGIATGVLALVGLGGLALLLASHPMGMPLFGVFAAGFFALQIAANFVQR